MVTWYGTVVEHILEDVAYAPDEDWNLLDARKVDHETGTRFDFEEGGLVFEEEDGTNEGYTAHHDDKVSLVVAPRTIKGASRDVKSIVQGLSLAQLTIDVQKPAVRWNEKAQKTANDIETVFGPGEGDSPAHNRKTIESIIRGCSKGGFRSVIPPNILADVAECFPDEELTKIRSLVSSDKRV